MKIIKRIFDNKGAPVLVAGFVVLFIMETRSRLRKRKQPRIQRAVINSVVGVPAFALLRFLFLPVMVKIAVKNQQLQWGLNYRYKAPAFVKVMTAFLIMDCSNYLWHVLNHKIPLLWRFHVVHHSDHDLDVTTAIRFHFGELIGSVFFRGAFIFLSGASAINVLVYEILFEGATQFHHSNWKLPFETEKKLNKIIVTPRMHGIHHSNLRQQTDSNYSVIFSFWDRIFNTVRLNVAQNKIVIGVPAYNNPDELTIGYLLKLPFTKFRKWEADENVEYKRTSVLERNQLAK